jgi:hypothetical protein
MFSVHKGWRRFSGLPAANLCAASEPAPVIIFSQN